MEKIVITEESALKSLIKSALDEFSKEQTKLRLYNVNQVAKRFGKAHATIKKLVKAGILKTTKDGLISETAIQEYLNK